MDDQSIRSPFASDKVQGHQANPMDVTERRRTRLPHGTDDAVSLASTNVVRVVLSSKLFRSPDIDTLLRPLLSTRSIVASTSYITGGSEMSDRRHRQAA